MCASGCVLLRSARSLLPGLTVPTAPQDGYCDQKRLNDILNHLESLEKAALSSQKHAVGKLVGRAAARAAASENSDGGESISRAGDSAEMWLADAGMVLRDPPVIHLLLHETVRCGKCRNS